jgi:uncharacterized membrane protein YhaH (DUF805 family)
MLNLFFAFQGRLRRREFLLWSIIVPCVLVLAPVVPLAVSAADRKTGLMEDLQAAGLVWPFFLLIALHHYISVALFWKRMNDVSAARRRAMWGNFTCYAYGILTALSALIFGLNMIALGQIEAPASGIALMAFWSMALWAPPERGPNEFGDDPRTGGGRFAAAEDTAETRVNAARVELAMERALAERGAKTAAAGPAQAFQKLPRVPEMARPQRPGFGKR